MPEGRNKTPGLRISGLPARGRASCMGFVESVTYQPASEQPFFSAIVVDTQQRSAGGGRPAAAARLLVIWLGRRRVPGIEAGVEVRLDGMVTVRDGLPAMFNPRYEILSRQEHL
ncbi:hypothetical protein [Arthrobacter cavernae]|uniref:Uncharacterized protein n=1 Tax=Arthrobacter cavernae TaxID=2817681 RepID=A0A939HEF7_9MICC|nr:hypothetical protein [Arthrobacter cavernae]MBO1269364.1 hypothetical protein [Arthrobacter cavernae]